MHFDGKTLFAPSTDEVLEKRNMEKMTATSLFYILGPKNCLSGL